MLWRSLLSEAPGGKHITHFYRDSAFLQSALRDWLSDGLAEGGGVVVLCTREHWELVQSTLAEDGFDTDQRQQEGEIAFLEVYPFLERFLESGRPDPAVFHQAIGEAMEGVSRACRDAGQIRAWGEAVEILRARGDLRSAQVLEELWNEAIDERGFSLLCSYHVHNLDPETHQGAMGRLADAHSDVIPEHDYARLNEAVDQALREIYGEDKACTLWTKLWARRVSASNMPTGQSVLSFFSRYHPEHAVRLFEQTRKHYLPVDVD